VKAGAGLDVLDRAIDAVREAESRRQLDNDAA